MSGFPIQTSASSPVSTAMSSGFDLTRPYELLGPEKSWFLLMNVLDIVFTFVLLNSGSCYESNPIANFVLQKGGFMSMVVYKLVIVLGVIMIANYIALKQFQASRKLLIAGTIMMGAVVTYSAVLLLSIN